jgi:AcrR family transcriptional regulator
MFEALPDVREPRQARSEETVRFIVIAANRLLDKRPWRAISLRDIAETAGVALGTLTARFRTRRALIDFLHQRHCDQELALVETLVSSDRWDRLPLEDALRGAVTEYVTALRRTHARSTAWYIESMDDARIRERRERTIEQQYALVADCARRVLPASCPRAVVDRVEVALRVVISTARDAMTFGPDASPSGQIDDRELIRLVTGVALRLLGVPGPGARN